MEQISSRATEPHATGDNVAVRVWQMLCGWAIRLARTNYLWLERCRLGPLLRVSGMEHLKERVTAMPASRVLMILDVLAAAGAQAWVAGGWGVDALIGRQTRRHHDLDLVVSNDHVEYLKVADALTRAGFRLVTQQLHDDRPLPLCYEWRHDGHTIEVLPVALHEPPFKAASDNAEPPFTQGSIIGRPVPCLRASLQVVLYVTALADCHYRLGCALDRVHATERAKLSLEQAVSTYKALGHRTGEANALTSLAALQGEDGPKADELSHSRRTVRLVSSVGNRVYRALALKSVSWELDQLSDYARGISDCKQALALQHEHRNRHADSDAWDILGCAYVHLGEYAEAAACYKRASNLRDELGEHSAQAQALVRLGDVEDAAGDPAAARAAWQSALGILSGLSLPDAAQVRARLQRAGANQERAPDWVSPPSVDTSP